ncbi:MAG: hypothetical protein JWR01_2326, partial [Subtercola sp.]|nr:hypothetical protein [Subtercola sp.]
MRLVETPVTAPDAQLLLGHYFASRELDFPPHLGTYRVTFPDPARFVPPDGLFVVLRGEGDVPLGCGGIRRFDDATFEVKHVWLEPA